MSEAKKAWNLLNEFVGDYSGRGVNHENQNFMGAFSLKPHFENKTLAVISTATGDKGEVYHNEKSWIGFDISGTLTMFVVSNNHPGVTPHPFDRIETGAQNEKKIVFRFGDPKARDTFREEINLTVFGDKSLEHFYCWGLPGGEFAPRSGARMFKQ